MRHTLCKEENYKRSQWMGGNSDELAVFPANASYLDRNFIWRISADDIETEEAEFPRLPDYDRVIMVLEGEIVLSYEGERVARLVSLEQDRFDGGWKTKSFGKGAAFNLTVRKGCEGYMDLIFPETESKSYTSTEETRLGNGAHVLFCRDGYCVVNFGGNSLMLKEGQLLALEYGPGEKPEYSVMGEGALIRSQIFYGDIQEEVAPEEIPREKASFDDFKQCVFLANVQFKWAEYLIKKLRTIWFDQELSEAVRKIERFFIPGAVFLLVAAAIGISAVRAGFSEGAALLMLLAWLITDCLLVSPLIYMCVVPKPVRKHIKRVEDLTPYERKIRDEELGQNPRLEKIMKKYKNSGKNLGR